MAIEKINGWSINSTGTLGVKQRGNIVLIQQDNNMGNTTLSINKAELLDLLEATSVALTENEVVDTNVSPRGTE